jgi:hypothetical protein
MEVRVNGEYIELGNSYPAITKKSIDINSPSTRFIDFTNRFDIPYTNENSRILENPNAIGSNNRAFDKLLNVTIEDVFKIFSGRGYLDSSNKDKFSMQVVDTSTELFKSLDKKLNTVNWDDKDLTLTTTDIDANDTVNIDSPWLWGKLCLHENAIQANTDQTTGDARCKYSRPSWYVQGLLKRAIALQGYNYSPSTMELAISAAHTAFYFTSYQKTIAAVAYNPAGSVAITGLNTNDFEQGVTTASTTINIGTSKTKFRLRGTVTSDAIMTLIVRATDNVDPTKISESKLVIGIGSQAVDFTTSEFQSTDGYTIDIRIDGTGTVTIDALLYTLLSDKDADLSTNPFLNYKIKVYDNLPDLTYLDLFRIICVAANQYQIVDSYNKTFGFGSMAQLNKMNSVDWSEKFIIDSESITSRFPGVFKKNWLKYENDITVNPELGWSSFITDNESLADEGDYIALKFGASIDTAFGAQMNIYNDTTRIPDQVLKMRLFQITGSVLEFEPLSWVNLAANYYVNWFNSMYRIRSIDADFNLSKLDVLKWHEKQLVYIDYFKTTFIVLEISNFIPNKKTKVKLLAYGR